MNWQKLSETLFAISVCVFLAIWILYGTAGTATANSPCIGPSPDWWTHHAATTDGRSIHNESDDIKNLFVRVWGMENDIHIRTWAYEHSGCPQPPKTDSHVAVRISKQPDRPLAVSVATTVTHQPERWIRVTEGYRTATSECQRHTQHTGKDARVTVGESDPQFACQNFYTRNPSYPPNVCYYRSTLTGELRESGC